MRSKLFVPGSRPELFGKAMQSAADAVSFDLEDAVTPERKEEARAAVASFLAARGGDGKTVVVRVNALGTRWFEDDIAGIAGPGLDVVNLPMVERAEDVRAAAAALSLVDPAGRIGVLANIETPRGLRLAAEIACADRRVVGLQVGWGDLLEPFGIGRYERAALDHVLMAVRFAAAEAGVAAYDGAFTRIDSPDVYRSECELARRLGYAGKSCIHPSQVAIANAAFTPDSGDVARARRIVEAAERADGVGAFVVDGRMVDAPFIASARALIALAERLGVSA